MQPCNFESLIYKQFKEWEIREVEYFVWRIASTLSRPVPFIPSSRDQYIFKNSCDMQTVPTLLENYETRTDIEISLL